LLNQTCIIAQTITTFAGTGAGTISGDGYPATSAGIPNPVCGSFDAAGNYYFAEDHSHPRVRKINLSGTITTVAGSGTVGFSGDDSLATIAKFSYPIAKVDSAGNIYIADYLNHRVRKVDVGTGIIHTIAGNGTATSTGDGGAATAATLIPYDLCPDKYGNLYIFDSGKVRKINTLGNISTVAGNGIPGFSGDFGPATLAQITASVGICFDAIGNLYIGCDAGTRIRKIDISTGIIYTIAGTGIYLYNGDGIHADSAQFKCYGIAFDTIGNLYIADIANQRIRKIDTSGIIHTVAGNGIMGYSGDNGIADSAKIHDPEGLALDACGNLYITDDGNNRIRKVTFNPACGPALDVDEESSVASIFIYPNPTNDILHIDNVKTNYSYTIVSIVGATMQQGNLNEDNNTIPLSSLPPGVYILSLTPALSQGEGDTTQRIIRKIIKQ